MRNDPMTDAPEAPDSPPGLTRRAVVRTGANLAWAVPAVSLATAAPALAVSGPVGQAKVALGNFQAAYIRRNAAAKITLASVANTGSADAGQVKAVVKFKKNGGAFKKAPKLSGSVSSGWKVAGPRSGYTFTFVSTDTHLMPNEKTRPLSFNVTLTKVAKRKTSPASRVTVAVTGKGTSASKSDSLPKFRA